MPASRSRTANWLRSLKQIHERGGSLELTMPRYLDDDAGNAGAVSSEEGTSDIIWRVRILDLTADEIVVEQPSVLGQTIELQDGVEVAGIITVGQNRWMFKSRILGRTRTKLRGSHSVTALRVDMPETVERCQRREFFRVKTVGVQLASVMCYPLDDPTTAAAAEAANRGEVLRQLDSGIAGKIGDIESDMTLPEVGPPFEARLLNLGGGGVGLLVEQEDRAALEAARFLWIRMDLRPDLPEPLCVCARLRHTHIDSTQKTYAGLSFEFGTGRAHQDFVVDQVCRYVAQVQRDLLRRSQKQA